MGKELRLFLTAVGLPAAVLLLLVLRFVTLERRSPAPRPGLRPGMAAHDCRPRPPRHRPGPWSERYEGDRFKWIVAGVIGLAALSTVSGGWVLMRSARKAREESLQKTDVLSNISHEFKTPLTTICLCAELAQDELHPRMLTVLRAFTEHVVGQRIKIVIGFLLDPAEILQKLFIRQNG